MAFEFLADALQKRKASSLLRVRHPAVSNKDGIIEIEGKHYINFASNDYLGLSQHEQVLQSYVEGLAVYGGGSGSSSVVSGYSAEHKALEEELCEAVRQPAAMIFSSGFTANQAICHALFGHVKAREVTSASQLPHIIADKLMHASFIQGALDTNAHFARYKHNDMAHAAQLMSKAGPNSLVATEGIFSMDGTVGNIRELQNIVATNDGQQSHNQVTYKPWLLVDDAHAFGVVGKSGFGSSDCAHVNPQAIDILMGTFGKALGTSGAFVAGSVDFIEYMVNTSKHYVYSTALGGAQIRATRASLALIEQGIEREKLQRNIDYFKQVAKQKGIVLNGSNNAIQPVVIGDPESTLACSQQLAELGLWVPAIRTPTVAKNTDRLRITLSAIHNKRDIDALIDGLVICLLPLLENASKKEPRIL